MGWTLDDPAAPNGGTEHVRVVSKLEPGDMVCWDDHDGVCTLRPVSRGEAPRDEGRYYCVEAVNDDGGWLTRISRPETYTPANAVEHRLLRPGKGVTFADVLVGATFHLPAVATATATATSVAIAVRPDSVAHLFTIDTPFGTALPLWTSRRALRTYLPHGPAFVATAAEIAACWDVQYDIAVDPELEIGVLLPLERLREALERRGRHRWEK